MEIFKILSVIFISAVLCIFLNKNHSEYSLFIVIICTGAVLLVVIKEIALPIKMIEQKIEGYGINNNYFKIALKALGIGYITSFIADSCNDSGQTALARSAITLGKCAIFLLSFPLVLSILETAVGLVK